MSNMSTLLPMRDMPRWYRFWEGQISASDGMDNRIVDLTDDAIRMDSFNPSKRLLLLENIISFAELGDVLCLSSGAPQINSEAP